MNFVRTVINHKRRKDQAVKASPLRFNSRKFGKRHQIIIKASTTVNYISLYLSFKSNTAKTRPPLGSVSFRSGSTSSMPLVEAQVFFLRNLPYSMLDSQLATHYHRRSDVTPLHCRALQGKLECVQLQVLLKQLKYSCAH